MRDLFGYRWAFRCTTDSSSDVVLGQGWANEGYTAAEIAPVYDTAAEPGSVLHAHPCVFGTLTAPSFGPVHSRRMRGKTVLPCRPRRDAHARRCPHGHDISCPTRHVEDDPRLGQPLCFGCHDYEAAVLFNAYAGDLWRRFTTYLPRQLARLAGVTQKELGPVLRIRYVKVAEYQARGVVHFHAVIRLDAPGDDYQPPPARYTAALLCDAIGQAASIATVSIATVSTGSGLRLGFGAQTDARAIRHTSDLPGTGQALSGQAVANYIAKYATKTLTVPGVPGLNHDDQYWRERRPSALVGQPVLN
jgi:hypothetical protein